MTKKNKKCIQKKYSLQDEPVLQPPRILTTRDHSHSAHGQFDMSNCWDKSKRLPIQTQESGRSNLGCAANKGKAPIVATRGGNKRIYNGHGGKQQAPSELSRNKYMDMLLDENTDINNYPNEHMDEDYEMNQCYDIHREEERIENELMNGSYEMNNHAMDRVWEDSRVENEIMNGSGDIGLEEGDNIVGGSKKTVPRGPTYMTSVWGRPSNLPKYFVQFNEFGQPIDGKTSELSHFLGTIARNGRFCPIDVTDWREMPSIKKSEMLDAVKLYFVVPVTAKKWILSSIAEKWKHWKNSLKTKYWKDVPVVNLVKPKDERILLDQWIKIIAYWSSDKAKKVSKRNQEARAKRIMKQITGKRSFAQVRHKLTQKLGRPPTRSELFGECYVKRDENSSNQNEQSNNVALSKYLEMQERINQLPEGSEDPIGRNDVFSQSMGPDRPGQVRMMGKGICPTDIWGAVPRGTSNRILIEQQSRIAELETMLMGQKRCGTSQEPSRQHGLSVNSLSNHVTRNLPLTVGAYVSLKSLFDPKKLIAKGRINSINPCTEVGGQILGSNWCEVNVKAILEPEEDLIRPYENRQMIADTLGEMIAWPCHLVTRTEG